MESNDYLKCKNYKAKYVSNEERYEFLRKIPLFRSWGHFELYRLAHAMTFRTFAKGMALISRGNVSAFLCFVTSGRVDVVRKNVGRSLSSIQEFGYFGESGVLNAFLPNRRNNFTENYDITSLTIVKALVLEPEDYHLLGHSTML